MKAEKLFRIIVADDDLDDQELIHQAFTDAHVNFVIVKFYDGVQLLDYLCKRHRYKMNQDPLPDLILLDLNMPLMDGFSALAEMQAHPQLKQIAVFVVTTSRSAADKKRALDAGAAGFYHKGASSSEIREIIRKVCVECFS